MRLAIIIFLWVVAAVCLITVAAVIYDLIVTSLDRKERKAREKAEQEAEEAKKARKQ